MTTPTIELEENTGEQQHPQLETYARVFFGARLHTRVIGLSATTRWKTKRHAVSGEAAHELDPLEGAIEIDEDATSH